MPGDKVTFIITSVIHFSTKKLPGSTPRSVFDPAERSSQTIKTIASIRGKMPSAEIILLEMGNEKYTTGELIKMADRYVYIGDRKRVRRAVDGKNRGLGEARGLIAAHKELDTGASFFFKMSGRYFLNEQFEPRLWQGDFFQAKKYETGISTRLYGFNRRFFNDWQTALKRSLWKLYRGSSIEDVFPAKFGHDRIQDIKKLGLSGYVANGGEYLEE
jgi:hypothetical protein